jgi:uncharacterized membrane protein YtjA (UPF0391 family)
MQVAAAGAVPGLSRSCIATASDPFGGGKRSFGTEFARASGAAIHTTKESVMLSWALAFFIIAIIAAVFGFTGIAAGAAEIAKILFVVFVVLFLVSLVAGLLRRP